ncbi:hypothetical protein BC833DRAFT_592557 [Globomyces pollinis-pini]|nr:hypothetical protein BC833DRAFT_592557 [Globomyces pollinis-pini]
MIPGLPADLSDMLGNVTVNPNTGIKGAIDFIKTQLQYGFPLPPAQFILEYFLGKHCKNEQSCEFNCVDSCPFVVPDDLLPIQDGNIEIPDIEIPNVDIPDIQDVVDNVTDGVDGNPSNGGNPEGGDSSPSDEEADTGSEESDTESEEEPGPDEKPDPESKPDDEVGSVTVFTTATKTDSNTDKPTAVVTTATKVFSSAPSMYNGYLISLSVILTIFLL